MTTEQMVNLIRANNQALSHRVLQAIADRLEEQDAHLRSALGSLVALENENEDIKRRHRDREDFFVRRGQVIAMLEREVRGQEEQLRGIGSELAESERHRQILTVQNKELLDSRKALEATCAPIAAWWELVKKDFWAELLGPIKDTDQILEVHDASESRYVTAGDLDALATACAGVKHG